MSSYIVDGLKYFVMGVILYFLASSAYKEIISLREANVQLTTKLEGAIEVLNKVAEHGEKVSEATARLEKADEERQKQLRGFERNLSTLAKSNKEYHAILSTVIPDALLTGLRSYQITTQHQAGGKQNPPASSGTP